jgi:hypothetical protein
MRKQIVILWLVVAAGLARAFAAAPDIAYVAFNGADTNPCSRTAPCKTITHALSIVAAGGVIDIAATGLYDNFTVTKAVTVKTDSGFVASIDVVGSSTGITINAGATDVVVLQGLTVHGQGAMGIGIQVNSAKRVVVVNCVSTNLNYGLAFTPSATADLQVKGGIYDGANTSIFICCAIGNTANNVALDGVEVYGGDQYTGINLDANVATLTHSTITGIGQPTGLLPLSGVNCAHGIAILEDNVITNFYQSGISVFSTAYLSSNTITGNEYGVIQSSGTAYSRGNNTIVGNINGNVLGTLTPFSPQ